MTTFSRAVLDLQARRALYEGASSIQVAKQGVDFWLWYSAMLRPGNMPQIDVLEDAPLYPERDAVRPFALWFSGGIESSYTLQRISHLEPDLLSIDDFKLFSGSDRSFGQIHFLCAVVSATLGYNVSYIGVERNDLLLTKNATHQGFIERSPEFLDKWSSYQPNRQMHTICRDLHKEEILANLVAAGGKVTGTCDFFKDGRWCGGCFKCFEAFYTAKAIGVSLGISLDGKKCSRYYSEYERFIKSGFQDNYNNAYQYFVRLQIVYGLDMDSANDCAL